VKEVSSINQRMGGDSGNLPTTPSYYNIHFGSRALLVLYNERLQEDTEKDMRVNTDMPFYVISCKFNGLFV